MNPTDFIENLSHKRRLVQRLFDEPVSSIPGNFDHIVDEALRKRAAILQLATSEATPFYLFDTQSFVAALTRFRDAFDAKIDRHRSFYAVKSNHHPYLVETAVEQGYGLDVSSGRELRQALDAGASEILFSGPAKSIADLALALDHASRVTINIDSFSELRKLGQLTQEREQTIRAGVRITTAHHGSWSKFGISLDRLPEFWNAAAAFPLIQMQGIQSHLSWTRQPTPYQQVIADVAKVLREQLTPAQRAAIKFYDFGGGYRPYRIEGFYPQETSQGELIAIADGYYGEESQYRDRYYVHDSADLPAYAEGSEQPLTSTCDRSSIATTSQNQAVSCRRLQCIW